MKKINFPVAFTEEAWYNLIKCALERKMVQFGEDRACPRSFFTLSSGRLLMRQIFGFLKPYAKRMTIGFVIKVVATIAELLIPWALKVMIDSVVPTGSLQKIILWGVVMVAFAAIAFFANVLANRSAALIH